MSLYQFNFVPPSTLLSSFRADRNALRQQLSPYHNVVPADANPRSFPLRIKRLCFQRVRPQRLCTKASISNYTTVLVVPTGVGASIGGYAGDALPAARLLSTVTDTLITHPNVLNGALMYWPIPNALYVEGYALDNFCTGHLSLQPLYNRSNRIGLLLDSAMPPAARLRHLQAADAARATLGLSVLHHTVTDQPLNVMYDRSAIGASWGTLRNPSALLTAASRLVHAGCDAIAIVAQFPDEDDEHLAQYRAGQAVDAIAGAEAVISHLVTRELRVPCAHAPSLPPLDVDDSVAPKAAAEELGYTFLSCVLVGLSRAPRLHVRGQGLHRSMNTTNAATDVNHHTICNEDVDAIIVPADAFGGSAVMSLAARDRDTLVIGVRSNETALNVSPSAVGIPEDRVVFANSYAEAAGFIAAHKAGIDLRALTSHVPSLARQQSDRSLAVTMS